MTLLFFLHMFEWACKFHYLDGAHGTDATPADGLLFVVLSLSVFVLLRINSSEALPLDEKKECLPSKEICCHCPHLPFVVGFHFFALPLHFLNFRG
mmetsp:Transcript_47451/g.122817  ORF Transcript_47451/g.122817 Transcript_47451/m.122817 type:complete len:96 (+) Transcript_47451:1402-1689(+)